ncbi:MAG TPA: ABC transporter family substrate-binding protein [Mycobacteriales bacterium]|nr:ABC transporter family substrate-binding protein [Mycobacteriales bacterium]
MLRNRRTAGYAAVAAISSVVIAACGGSSSGGSGGGNGGSSTPITASADSYNSGTAQSGGTFTYVIEANPANWNLDSAEGNNFNTAEILNMIYPGVYNDLPDTTNVQLNTDLVTSATETSTNPQTVVYKINPKAVWSDGVPITYKDFQYAWETQDTGPNNPHGHCPTCEIAGNAGYDQIKSVSGSDGGKTVTVVFKTPFGDWKSLFGAGYGLMPEHLAAQHGSLADSFNNYFSKTVPTVSGGPFEIQSFKSNQAVTLVPNPKYYGAAPKLSKLIFRIITDASAEPTALQNHEVDAIYPQPELDLVDQIKALASQGVKYQLDLGLDWEHFDFNLHNKFLQSLPLRQALFTAVDRQAIIARTVGQFDPNVKVLNNRFLMPDQAGYQDDVTSTGLGSGDIAAAKEILTKAGYKGVGTKLVAPNGQTVPAFTMKYTVGNTIRQTECDLFAQYAKQLGVTVNVSSTDDLGASLTHADPQHDYDIIVFAWVGTPFFASGSASNYNTGGGNNFGGYSNPMVDKLMKQAVASSDRNVQVADVNKVDLQLSKDAYTLPLYQKPTFLAYYDKWVNIRDNATNQGPTYNAYQWGLGQSS